MDNEQWPPELDALAASAQHHKLLFENDLVRVIDTCIPPGEITALHTHQWPASLYFISWSDFVRRDAAGNITADSRTFDKKPAPHTAVWGGSLTAHTLQNAGINDLHVISVEVKHAEK